MGTGPGAVSRRKTGVIAALSVLLLAATVGACTGPTANSSGIAKPVTTNSAGTARPAARARVTPTIGQARVTGYVKTSLIGQPSGPVSVVVRGASAARLYHIVEGLRAARGFPCAENAQMYQITFTFTSAAAAVDVTGAECGGAVYITSRGKSADRIDIGCTLLSAVRRLLPATATDTQQLNAPCQLPAR
jgi:hypothetical protein